MLWNEPRKERSLELMQATWLDSMTHGISLTDKLRRRSNMLWNKLGKVRSLELTRETWFDSTERKKLDGG